MTDTYKGGDAVQLNQATDYAFRVVLFLSGLPQGEVAKGVVIAEIQNIPPRFLQKIMHRLTSAGLIIAYRGAGGGFCLTKPPEEITLYDVILAMEGPLALHRCLADRNVCIGAGGECPVHRALAAVQDSLVVNLTKVTFAQLLAKPAKQ